MHLQMSRILNIILVQAKNDEERSAITVSYTHLDVYKRQEKMRVFIKQMEVY